MQDYPPILVLQILGAAVFLVGLAFARYERNQRRSRQILATNEPPIQQELDLDQKSKARRTA
jgi:hypothetical protein